ncbi:MAG: DUF4160 domain-containing protein [Proteobacteria bacterium]|nr:DUF4160 domain-containing protein [Pseudomonadota bacterium]
MLTISMFYGIIIRMYALDTKQHHLPHIHVEYAEAEAVFQIPDGEILEGALPAKQNKLVQAWMALHADELMADWKLAAAGSTPYKIDPLR